MENLHVQRVHQVIDMLREIDVDGETLQYIIEKVGMTDQMLRQLIFLSPKDQLEDIMDEVVEYQKIRGY